jgi:2-polyprenyl-3-methyl-5-hydroxy-6-metoxy-1,4-benzoquinol methylase
MWQKVVEWLWQTRDPNFIGYSKYREHGAFHWNELERNNDYQRRVGVVLEYVAPASLVLDIGCGDGAYISRVAPKSRSVVGVDADFFGVREARRKLAEAGIPNVRCLQLPISGIPAKLAKMVDRFDVVYAMDVIEHLPDPDDLVDVAARMVQPEGVVLIGTPIFVRADLVSPYHVREFQVAEIRETLEKRLDLQKGIILPLRRGDGVEYEEGYYIGVASRRRTR